MMNNTKVQALELRKKGYSYTKISGVLNVSKGTLSYWFKNINWSEDATYKNTLKNLTRSRERILRLNTARQQKLQAEYTQVSHLASVEFSQFKSDPVFIAALMLYLGEGDKSNKNNLVRIGNIDSAVLIIFIKFIQSYCPEYGNKIRFWLLHYSDNDLKICENWWSKQINVSHENFYKAQLIQGKHKQRKLPYGVGNITISGKALKIKILTWIELLSEDLKRV